MITTVIFDVGGVLVRTMDPEPRRRLELLHDLEKGAAEQMVFNSSMGMAAQRGQISAEELWAWVGSELNMEDHELAEFRQAFFQGDRLDRQLIATIESLRPRYQTAIISNAMDDLNHVLTAVHPVAHAFDLIVGSAYEGIMKPDPRIFRRTLDRLNCTPEQALFVDDFAHNVRGAQDVGLTAIHFTPSLDLPAALASHGVTA